MTDPVAEMVDDLKELILEDEMLLLLSLTKAITALKDEWEHATLIMQETGALDDPAVLVPYQRGINDGLEGALYVLGAFRNELLADAERNGVPYAPAHGDDLLGT